ncbi:hypothetical protein BH23GEM10_BH23GEM10_13260 [soil metagenome]
MKRLVLATAIVGTTLLTACGSGEIIVQAQAEQDGSVDPVGNLQVRALPYDRDAVFDSLAAAHSEPEPQIPADLMALQDSIAQANRAWTSATARWNIARDSAAKMSQRLQGMSRASGEYVVLFRQTNTLFDEEAAQKRTMDSAFSRFESLQSRFTNRAQEAQTAMDQWADIAYTDFDRVTSARMAESGLAEVVDTTNANGVVRITGLKKGRQYWVHARYELAFEELYWNIPVTPGDEPVQIELNRATAQVRPKL